MLFKKVTSSFHIGMICMNIQGYNINTYTARTNNMPNSPVNRAIQTINKIPKNIQQLQTATDF